MNAMLKIAGRSYMNGVPVDDVRDLIASVEKRPSAGQSRWRVSSAWRGRLRSSSRVDSFDIGGRAAQRPLAIEADAPHELGGTDNHATPQEYLLAALNACMMARFTALCALHGLEIYRLDITSEGDLDLRGALGLDPAVAPGFGGLRTTVTIKGPAPAEDYRRIFETVLATSSALHSLTQPVSVTPDLVVV